MSSRHFFFAFALLASVAVGRPVATPAPAEAAPAPAADVPPFQLKNKSAFTSTSNANARAPFWPIGWTKRTAAAPQQVAAEPVAKFTLDEKSFKVTSILLGSGGTQSLAVINGRPYGEGEFVRMPKQPPGTAPVRVQVRRIADGQVTLQHAEQVLVVAITRPELNSHRPEELLLDDPNR